MALRAGAAVALALATAAVARDAAGGNWVAAWYSPPFPTTVVWDCNQTRTFAASRSSRSPSITRPEPPPPTTWPTSRSRHPETMRPNRSGLRASARSLLDLRAVLTSKRSRLKRFWWRSATPSPREFVQRRALTGITRSGCRYCLLGESFPGPYVAPLYPQRSSARRAAATRAATGSEASSVTVSVDAGRSSAASRWADRQVLLELAQNEEAFYPDLRSSLYRRRFSRSGELKTGKIEECALLVMHPSRGVTTKQIRAHLTLEHQKARAKK